MSLINMMASIGGRIPLDFAFLGANSNSGSSSSYTFNGVSIGTADANRMVVITLQGSFGIAGGLTAVTIGGSAATLVAASGSLEFGAIAYRKVPTGTTTTVVVSVTNGNGCKIGRYRFNTTTSTALDSGTHDTGATSFSISDIACEPNGVVIESMASNGTATAITSAWNGIDTRVHDYNENFDSDKVMSGHVLTTESSTVRDMAFTSANFHGAVVVSF